MFTSKTLIVFAYVVFLLSGCKERNSNEIDFKKLQNKATIFLRDLDVFIQYGVDKDGDVRYVVVSKDLDSTALTIEQKLMEHGKRSAAAKIQIENRDFPPPTSDENLIYCDKSGVFRGKLEIISEPDFKRKIEKINEARRESFLKMLSGN
jgi:hypothetical protein